MIRLALHIKRDAIIFVVCVFAAIGCKKEKRAQSGQPPGAVRTGTGIVRGAVTLAGKPPAVVMVPNQPCHAGAGPIPDENVVVSPQGRLQNVIVYLEDPPPAPPGGDLPPVMLDQVDCHFVPHVVALRTRQTLHVMTKDATFHNVHGTCTVNDPFNFALVAAGQSKELKFDLAEIFQVRCDVHPWMKSWVGVFSHPYFAVTGTDGKFEIRNVPSGRYTLIAWHEKYGRLRIPLEAVDGQTVTAPVSFQSGL